MELKRLDIDTELFPPELRRFVSGAALYDSSCSPEASVVFVDKDGGYFIKSAPGGSLKREAEMTSYFNGKGLAPAVVMYLSGERDLLMTEKIPGDDCTAAKYLEHPTRLCDTLAELLKRLHATEHAGCPVTDLARESLAAAEKNFNNGVYDRDLFPDNWGYRSAEEAFGALVSGGRLLNSDTLLHGDYCLPNVILDEWDFGGFVDVGGGGVGDRHADIFWGLWSLAFNLKTDAYRERFIDAYGRGDVDAERLRVIAAIEVFK